MKKFFNDFTCGVKNDVLAGITVSLAMIPEVVAFAFVAHINPLMALSGAFMVGLITAIFGGRPGLISGAAGAVAVVFAHMILSDHVQEVAIDMPDHIKNNIGIFFLMATVMLMGLIQVVAGVFKLGRFVRLIPHSVMMGFVNGLSIVIFWAQVKMFTNKETYVDEGGVTHYKSVWMKLDSPELWWMLALVLLTMGLCWGLPKLSKKIPAALTAILITTGVAIIFKMDVSTVGSYIIDGGGTGLKGELPSINQDFWQYLPFNMDTLMFILPFAFLAASVGLIESLMTMNLVDELTETRGKASRECVAQGAGNIVSGLFGGTGGCGMIGQTVINIKAGGRGRLSGIIMAVTLLVFILFADKYIEQVPIAALIGVMFMMVIETFAWSSFRILRKIPKADAVVLITVSVVTVIFDLAIAVFVGVIISALAFAWKNATMIRARIRFKEDGTKVYDIWGPLFFGAIQTFNTRFEVKTDPAKVEIDFMESKVCDYSGVEAIKILAQKYRDEGKQVILKHLSPECQLILLKADPSLDGFIATSIDDPRYYIMNSQELDIDEISDEKVKAKVKEEQDATSTEII